MLQLVTKVAEWQTHEKIGKAMAICEIVALPKNKNSNFGDKTSSGKRIHLFVWTYI